MGITHTADCILGLITSEELDGLGQLIIKQLKNRWGDLSHYRRFVVGVDIAKMQIYDLEDSAQKGITQGQAVANSMHKPSVSFSDDSPVFDKGNIGKVKKKDLFSAGELM